MRENLLGSVEEVSGGRSALRPDLESRAYLPRTDTRQGGSVGEARWANLDRVPWSLGAVARDRGSGSTGCRGEEIHPCSEAREVEVGTASGSSAARGGPPADGTENLGQRRGRQAAVMGLALRCALDARPSGSQGSAPAKAHEKIRST